MTDNGSRICFLSIRNISHISSLHKYEKILNNHYDIVYWNRLGITETCSANNIYCYNKPLEENLPWNQKLRAYMAFRKYALKIIKSNNYDKIIVLPTQTALVFFDILTRKFAGRYVFDIRDYTAENHVLFSLLMRRLIRKAGVVSLTSPAYKTFLPKCDYVISHNWAPVSSEQIKAYRNRNRVEGEPIKIYCVGGIRFLSYFKRLINVFANDNRFVIGFIGEGAEKLRAYVEKENISNIVLEGRFSYQETVAQHSRSDIANNLFGNHTPSLDYALSNRLYYAIQLGMPILACPDTYTAKVLSTHKLGFIFDINDSEACDKLWEYYTTLDREQLYKNCDGFMQEVWTDEEVFRERISHFLCNGFS